MEKESGLMGFVIVSVIVEHVSRISVLLPPSDRFHPDYLFLSLSSFPTRMVDSRSSLPFIVHRPPFAMAHQDVHLY